MQRGFRLLALGDVLRHAEQVLRLPRFVQNGDFFGMEEAEPVILGVDGLFRDVEGIFRGQDFTIVGGEGVCFFFGKEVVV